MEHEGAGILVKVTVPDLKCQTRVVINKLDPIGSTKETVLEKITHVSKQMVTVLHSIPN